MHEPDATNVYSVIGFTLIYIQGFERNIKFCTTFVLQGDLSLTWERLQSIDREERKKALGHFISLLRSRASLHPAFEELLTSVLRDRNDFIHNTDRIPGWNLSTLEGIKVAKTFCLSLVRRTHFVNEILATLFGQWQDQAGFKVPVTPEQETYFRQLETRYGHLVETYIAHREA